jgi:aerobic-type carbon monoxide dehydrogenase small subunit (CoxS/CutS family)
MAEPDDHIVIRVNGTERRLRVERSRTLLSVLRAELGLMGTKYGCGAGECGACTVLLAGEPVRACTTPVSHAEGRAVTTIEGLGEEGALHTVQQAFLDMQAFQCGYCTPGMIMGAVALLQRNPHASELEIKEGMAGHLCRCGSYDQIVRAIQLAAERMRA